MERNKTISLENRILQLRTLHDNTKGGFGFYKRLFQFMTYLSSVDNQLLNKLGLKLTTLQSVLSKESEITPDIFMRVCLILPNTKSHWLFFGEDDNLIEWNQIKLNYLENDNSEIHLLAFNEIKTRLIEIMNYYSMSNVRFASEIGIKNSLFSSILKGKEFVSIEIIRQIFIRFPNLNLHWFLFGKQELLPFENPVLPNKIKYSNIKIPNSKSISINDKFRMIMGYYSMNNKVFSAEIGITETDLTDILSGLTIPSLEVILNTNQRFRQLNLNWLLLDENDFFAFEIKNRLFKLQQPQDIKERIELLIRSSGLRIDKFASEISIQESNLTHSLKDTKFLSIDILQAICNRFQEINLEWLLLGEGDITPPLIPIKYDESIKTVNKIRPMEINNRIKEIMDHYSMSIEVFAEEIKLQESMLIHLLNGRNKANLDIITNICNRFNDININWLLFGEGEFLLIPHQSSPNVSPSIKSTSIIDRINLIKKQVGMNNEQFSKEIGIQESTLNHIEGGRNKPSVDVIRSIIKRFPQFNLRWFVLGEGEMLTTTV